MRPVLTPVARAHRAGRSLLIGTTDLDSGRAVTGDVGAIAASDAAGALELFRKILVASTSVPGAVSPVMIGVEANGKHYQEMHADGGVLAQVFLYPSRSLEELSKATGKPFRRELHSYVLRNGRVEPEWLQSKRRTLGIRARAISMLIQAQGISDLSQLYLTAKQDGADFNLAYIDSGFTFSHESEFDTEYMRRLFEYGYERAAGGYPWRKTPRSD